MVGSWLRAADLKTGMKAKITSETNPVPSQFQNKDGSVKNQDVCKIKVEGFTEEFNVALNRATLNALVDAFGENSADWQNRALTVETEKMRVGGKAVVALYLLPQGYEKVDDDNGYAMIVKTGEVMAKQAEQGMPQADEDLDEVNAELSGQKKDENLPF